MKATGKIHARKISKAGTLARVIARLQRSPATTLEIIRDCGVCAVNSIIAEIRANGIAVNCSQIGRGKFLYSLAK